MYKIIATLILSTLTSLNLHAEEPPANAANPNADLEANKAAAAKRIDERIEVLGKLKACSNAATNPQDLKACHKEHKEAMSSLRLEMMNARMEKMQMRRDKMDQKIKDMESKKQEAAHAGH